MEEKKYTFSFIDLFAGLGGFHVALESLGGKCVFASELKSDLQKLYAINFPGSNIEGDISKINPRDIPDHDVLCAGFPCQPFSQAGKRQGFKDELGRGNLFNYICQILYTKKPKYLLLENVSNLKGHDSGNTWNVIYRKLTGELPINGIDQELADKFLDYEVSEQILSPHEFGWPQHRKRIYIVGIRKSKGGLGNFSFPSPNINVKCSLHQIIDEGDTNVQNLKLDTIYQLKVWEEFIQNCYKYNMEVPSFPVWAMEFGCTYPYREMAPSFADISNLKGSISSFGKVIEGDNKNEILQQLPVYSQTSKTRVFPSWKIRYIEQNREFYKQNKTWIDSWLVKVRNFENSHLKLEWNCGSGVIPTLKDKIVQFRASGIRVKLPTYSPALNLIGTQIPILPWIKLPQISIPKYSIQDLKQKKLSRKDILYGRYLTIQEAAKLQGMESLKFECPNFSLTRTRIFEALGNAVNTNMVKIIATNLIKQ